MRLPHVFLAGLTLAAPLMASPALAQEGFDPADSCNAILTETSPTTRMMAASWLIGMLDGPGENARPVNAAELDKVLTALTEICGASPDASLFGVARAALTAQAEADSAAEAPTPGSEADARLLLSRFLDPDTDREELTWSLVASPEDIRAVYEEPLASRMIETYAQKLTRGVSFDPRPEQTELLIWQASAAEIKSGAPVVDNFPGGYRKVAPFLKPGFDVVQFKFVEPGSTSGMSADGLIWVNDHWAWMPKPWRMLD